MTRFASVVLLHASLVHHDRVFTYSVPDAADVAVGSLVRVPLGRRTTTGVVVDLMEQADVARVVPIRRTLGPGLGEEMVSLARWVSERYLSTMGEALAAVLPARVADEESVAPVAPSSLPRPPQGPFVGLLARPGHAGFSLAAAPTPERGAMIANLALTQLAAGRGALILLPEVRIRTQVAAAIEETLGDAVAWLGADRSPRQRYRAWLDLRAGVRRVACGGRAAVFAPVQDLGMVIVDDEAHVSYKERRAPRFHARTVAAERARRAGATLAVVGVPPSIEVAAATTAGRMKSVPIPSLEQRRPVRVVDLAANPERLVPSGQAVTAGGAAIKAGRRVLVLTHRGGDQPARLLERAARAMGARDPARLDARTPEAELRRALARADLIVATAVVAKDLPFPRAGVAIVCHADAALTQTGFRTAEEAFAVWWRVAHAAGSVVIETAQPSHPAVRALVRFDPGVLAAEEIRRRRELGYPPFGGLARIVAPAEQAAAFAKEVEAAGGEVLGPTQRGGTAVFAVRAPSRGALEALLAPLATRWRADGAAVRIDVDPREVLA